MIDTYNQLLADIDRVKKIEIIPNMLEIICRATGMGFAAVARVTQDKWIACSVRDEIQFGLEPGGELQIETTICNEIRQSGNGVIIDHVASDSHFSKHHTPRMYGFQSYISIPIILKNGEFFGTLCAIDPSPNTLNNTQTVGMFKMFAELIAFHLQQEEIVERSIQALDDMTRELADSKDENRQYRHISSHNLQEPLRKIRVFSSMLLTATADKDAERTKELATRVSTSAQRVSMMIQDLSDLTALHNASTFFDTTNLKQVLDDVCLQLRRNIQEKNARVQIGELPAIYAIPAQLEQLFFHLIGNALKFTRGDEIPVIRVNARSNDKDVEIVVADNGIGIDRQQLEKIFDIFAQLSSDPSPHGFGTGLAFCRKIVRNHKGTISAQSEKGKGTIFTITLPLSHRP